MTHPRDPLRAALREPDPEAVRRLQATVAARIATAPLPAPPGLRQRLQQRLEAAAPAGWGALAATLGCLAWFALLANPAPREDPVALLQSLPYAAELL